MGILEESTSLAHNPEYIGQTPGQFYMAEIDRNDNTKQISHGFSRANSFILSMHFPE